MKSLIIILTAFISIEAFAQNTVQGHVIDGETNKPLQGATVFIANTTYGLSSGKDGEFIIKGLPSTYYKLIISFVGYETQQIEILPDDSKTYTVILKPRSKELNEIVIRSNKTSRAEWLANFRIFKEHFIGLSENAKHCIFQNPSILSFKNDLGILHAFADSTLILENRGLGYRIKILLGLYQFNIVKYDIYYQGEMVFEPLTPANDEEKVKWARNRLRAYYGSEMHFLRSLYNKDLFNNGFYYNLVSGINRVGIADTVITPPSPVYNNRRIKIQTLWNYNNILDTARSTDKEPILSYKGDLEIQYINEAETSAYQYHRNLFVGKSIQKSTMKLHKPCIILPHGQVYPPNSVETKNYWSWELVAESLPLNYDPRIDLAIIASDE